MPPTRQAILNWAAALLLALVLMTIALVIYTFLAQEGGGDYFSEPAPHGRIER